MLLSFFFLLLLSGAHGARIVGQYDSIVSVNNGPDLVTHYVDVLLTAADENPNTGAGFTVTAYDSSNPSIVTSSSTLRNDGLAYRYAMSLEEYAPLAARNVPGEHCLLPSDSANLTALESLLKTSTSPAAIRARARVQVRLASNQLVTLRKKARFLPFLATAVAGAIGGYLLSEIFGSGSEDRAKFAAINIALQKIDNQLIDIGKWQAEITLQSSRQQTFDNNVIKQVGAVQNQISTLGEEIDIVFKNVKYLSNITEMLNQQERADFLLVQNEFALAQAGQSALINYTHDSVNLLHQQLQGIAATTDNLATAVQQLNTNFYNEAQDLYMRRGITGNFWANVNQDNAGIADTPFMEYVGTPPLDPAAVDAQRNIAGSQVISRLRMSYTRLDAGVYMAVELIISYRCDTVAIASNTIPKSTFQSLFQQLGPDDSLTDFCYDPAGTVYTSWNCTCVVTVEKRQCVLSSANRYPWDWGTDAVSLSADPRSYGYCGNTIPIPIAYSPANNLVTQTDIFSNVVAWNQYLTAFCTDTPFVASTNSTSLGMKIRLYSDLHDASQDFALSSVNVTDVCQADFSTFPTSTNNEKRLAYGIYAFWKLSYDKNQEFALPAVEKNIYGQMGSNIEYHAKPFNSFPTIADTFRCWEFYYTKISAEKVPIYRVDPLQIDHAIYVTVNDGPEIAVPSNSTIPFTLQGATSITSQVIKSASWENLLPGTFQMAGAFVDTTRNPPRVFDIPFSMFGDGSAISRRWKVNHIYQPAAWHGPDDPITPLSYWNDTGYHYDPQWLGDSPQDYARTVTISGEQQLCEDAYDMHDVIVPTTGGAKDLCTLMQFFRISVENTASGLQLVFRPNDYILRASLSLPAGLYKQRIFSSCPVNYTVVQAPNEWVLTFYTNSIVATTITAVITTYKAACAPAGPYEKVYSQGSPATVLVHACGQAYVNIFTTASDVPCYPDPGISAFVPHQSGNGPAAPSYVAQAISDSIDVTRQQAIALDGQLSQLRSELNRIGHQSWASIDALEQAVRDNLQQQQDLYEQAKINSTTPVQQAIDDEIERLRNDTQKYIDDQARNKVQADIVIDTNAQQLNLSQQMNASLVRILALEEQIRKDQIETSKAVADANDAISKSDCNARGGIFGPITCAFDSVASFFRNFGFGGILNLFVIIIVVVLLFCCMVPLVRVLSSCCGSLGSVSESISKAFPKKQPSTSSETKPLVKQ